MSAVQVAFTRIECDVAGCQAETDLYRPVEAAMTAWDSMGGVTVTFRGAVTMTLCGKHAQGRICETCGLLADDDVKLHRVAGEYFCGECRPQLEHL